MKTLLNLSYDCLRLIELMYVSICSSKTEFIHCDRDWLKKNRYDQNLTTNENSIIFELSLWNLVKMTSQWGGLFDLVSWW